MIEFLKDIDRSIFLFLNGMNSPNWDQIQSTATKSLIWLPVYFIFLYLVIRKYKWQTLLIFIIAALALTVSDQLSNVAKELFHRLRPSNEPGLPVHLVNAYKGGTYGFYSAHASNSFTIAVFLIMLLKRYYRYFFIPVLIWALFLSYTRIYLGVHYPGDTLTGIVAGSLIGYGAGKLFFYVSGALYKT